MSLYLVIFADDISDREIDSVEVGPYSAFGEFRDAVAQLAESGRRGSRFPMLMNHPDSDGMWSPADAARLVQELTEIRRSFVEARSPGVTGERGRTLLYVHVDVEGLPIVDRLIELARTAIRSRRPILFQ